MPTPCYHWLHIPVKGTSYKSHIRTFKTDITHDRVLGISVNITTFGRIYWVGWRLGREEDGRGWTTTSSVTADTPPPLFLGKRSDSSPFDHQLILPKDHFMRTAKKIEILNLYFSEEGCL